MTKRLVWGIIVTLALASGQGRRRMPTGSTGTGAPPIVEPAASFKGVLKGVDHGKILIDLPDGNVMEFRTSRKTVYKVKGKPGKIKDLEAGQRLEIEARHVVGVVEAVTVTVLEPEAKP